MNLKRNDDFLFTYDSYKSALIKENNLSYKGKSIILVFHKIFDGLNYSILALIFLLSFLSLNSQRRWTSFYSGLREMQTFNNNLIDYIAKTEEFYIDEIEKLDEFKKTTSKDLIYLFKNIKPKKNKLSKYLFDLQKGIEEGKYQRGNL